MIQGINIVKMIIKTNKKRNNGTKTSDAAPYWRVKVGTQSSQVKCFLEQKSALFWER